jgi:hypothetical protein
MARLWERLYESKKKKIRPTLVVGGIENGIGCATNSSGTHRKTIS